MTEAFRLTVEDHGTASRSARRTTRSASRGRSCATASTRWPAGWPRLGVRRGDTVALMMGNRPEFHIADLAVMTLGGTPFSIYPTFTPAQIAYVVGDAGAKLAIVEAAHLETFRTARAELPALETVIVIDTQPIRRRAQVGPGARTRSRGPTSRAPTRPSTPSRTGAAPGPRTS